MLKRVGIRLPWGPVFAAGAMSVGVAFSGCSAPPVDDVGGGDPGGDDFDSDIGDTADGTGGGSPGAYCDEVKLDFTPKTPTVYVMVDRSGSIWGNSQWVPLRDAVLPVIQELQADVRFGFGSFAGVNGASCGITDMGAIALNNYDAIATHYNGLTQPQGKIDTPSIQAVREVVDLLKADTEAPGGKFILFVTADTDQDFCNDVAMSCATDALVATLQIAAAENIRTFVFGLANSSVQNAEWFDFWAQAGVGEQPNWAAGLNVNQYSGQLHSECYAEGKTLWETRRAENGNSGLNPAGKYSTEGGQATAILTSNPQEVADQIRTRVQSLKSCVFDLTSSGVSMNENVTGDVFVNDEVIPADQWHRVGPTVLEITGDACNTWLKPEVTAFRAGFACEFLTVN